MILAIDQGTTGTTCLVFDADARPAGRAYREFRQHFPRPGWVEHDAVEIWRNLERLVPQALRQAGIGADQVVAVGIANQRETIVLWDRHTGVPIGHAIGWQDTRTDRIASALDRDERGDVIRRKAGLPPATYFSAGKVQWILENVDGVRADA